MAKRIISTIALWAIVLTLLHFFGAAGAVWIVAAITALTLWEFYALLKHMGFDPFDKLGIALGIATILIPFYGRKLGLTVSTADILAFAVIAFSVRILGERDAHSRVETLAGSLFGIVYVAAMLKYFVNIIELPGPHEATGLVYFIWLIAVSKFCDVGALLSGMAFGRHKMAPVISPKKTWEGAAGGVLVSMGIGAGLSVLAHQWLPAGFTPIVAALIALPVALIAIVADLVESIIKRRATIKDSGATIPGIGGMFDVTDSLILTAPLGYVLLAQVG
ncbi:phosphatidate cytidylyltransferase [Nibricoccus sp. IMCC34717]|uniref:phosphatidate cytidylyltransferase n=1 Tax=Nibricoccus sp. IMCC34717 TaxID=3034021 RepID=UPI00384B4859